MNDHCIVDSIDMSQMSVTSKTKRFATKSSKMNDGVQAYTDRVNLRQEKDSQRSAQISSSRNAI